MNRRALSDALEAGNIRQSDGALFVLELDYFKKINDNHGHDAGDYVLTHFTNLVRSQLREFDLLARIGGEEFVVIVPDVSVAQAQNIAQRTCVAIRESELQYNDVIIRYTVSIGAVLIQSEC